MNRVLSIVALLMLTIGAWAETERVNITATGGQVEYSISGTTCTLTATPNSGYFLVKNCLTAVKVISGSVVQAPARRSIDIDDENVTITATDESADPSGVTTYTFTMPEDVNISVNVTANFLERASISNATITLAQTTFTYDGTAKKPAVTKVDLQGELTTSEYAVSYKDSVNAGTATVIVTGKGIYSGTASATFTIDAADIEDATIAAIANQTFTGDSIKPNLSVTFGETPMALEAGKDYTVAYTDNVSAGTATATATITGKGNFKGTKTATFTITAKAITADMVTLSQEPITYNGSDQTPMVEVVDGQTELSEDDYDVSYQKVIDAQTTEPVESTIDAGDYNVVVTAKENGNYSGTVTKSFTINAASLANATIAEIADTAYVGVDIEPELTVTVTVTLGETQEVLELEQGEDYTVAYTNNISAGQATATITGTGNYTGSKTANFNITAKAITGATVTLTPESDTYDGSAKTPETVTVVLNQKTLTVNTDYTISYQKTDGETTTNVTSPTDAGTYNVVVTAKGNYSGTASATFTIDAADIEDAAIAAIADQTFTGDSIKPNLSVTFGNYTLVANKDYTVAYTDNVSAGTATATITGKGNYKGTKSATFTILNRTLDITKLTFNEGWTTFYSPDEELELPEGYGAYVPTGIGDGVVTLTQIGRILAETPVLLNNATETTTDNLEYTYNFLRYADGNTEVYNNYFYGLYNGEFMRVTGTIPAGKVYLYAVELQAPQLKIVIDDEANMTGISDATRLNDKAEMINDNLYDLQGRKVIYPKKKGLYIKNGRKVVVNNK